MVDDGAVEPFGGTGETTGREAVGAAGPRIAAWMSVTEDDTRAPAACCVGDDRADGQFSLRLSTVMPGEMDAVQLVVDVGHEQALPSWIRLREAAGEEVAGCCESVELERPFGTLIAHPIQLCGGDATRDSNRDRLKSSFIHNGCECRSCAGGPAH